MGGIKTISIIVAANIKGLESGLGKANKSIAGFASNAARLGSMLSFGITAPLTALGKSAFNTFTQFEDSMTRVQAVTGSSTQQIKMLTDEAKRLGATTQFTARQVADLQLVLGRKGFDPTAIKDMEGAILDLALATGEDLSLAAEVVANSINAFGLESEKAGSVANTLASAAANSSIQLSTFATAFGHAGASAKAVGVDIEELSAMMGVLMDNGIKASKAGTGLRKMFGRLNEEGIAFGTTLDRLASGEMSLNDATELVGITAANQLLILAQQRDEVNKLTTEYKTNTTALSDMTDLMGKTSKAKVAIMNSAIESMKIEIGSLLAEALLPLIQEITELATSFKDLDPSTKEMILKIGGLAAVIGPLLLTVALFTTAIGALGGAFKVLTGLIPFSITGMSRFGIMLGKMIIAGYSGAGALGALSGAFRALTIAIAANPIGLIAVAITAIGVAVYKFSKNTEEATTTQDDFMFSTWETHKALLAQEKAMLDAEKAQNKLIQAEINRRKLADVDIKLDSVSTNDLSVDSSGQFDLVAHMKNQKVEVLAELKRLNELKLAEEQRFANGVKALSINISTSFADSFANVVASGQNLFEGLGNIFIEIGKMLVKLLVKSLILSAIFSSFPGLGGFGAEGLTSTKDILGSLMGGLEGRASGGPVMGSTPYMVGEKGPELFVPGANGAIIPNHALGGGGGAVIPDVRISGNDLLIVFDRAERRKNRR